MYWSGHRQTGALVTNIPSKLRAAIDLCQNMSLVILLGSSDNSYTVPRQSDICV